MPHKPRAVRELRPGLWHWEAPHPDWQPSVPWHHTIVSSYALDDGECLLLVDPLAVPSEIEELAADRDTAIVLTCPWHKRDALGLVERLGAPVFVPPPDEGTPDVAWLLAGNIGEGKPYAAGDRLPVGVEAFPGKEPNDVVLWIENYRAVEVVLATHGGPIDRGALERALPDPEQVTLAALGSLPLSNSRLISRNVPICPVF